MELGGHVGRMREMTNAYNILVQKLEGKWQLGRHRRRREEGINTDRVEIGSYGCGPLAGC